MGLGGLGTVVKKLRSIRDVLAAVKDLGFLAWYPCEVPGGSVYERVPADFWEEIGPRCPWIWRYELVLDRGIAYGAFLNGKIALFSLDAFADLANHRRDGLDFLTRCACRGIAEEDLRAMEPFSGGEPVLATDVPKKTGLAVPAARRALARLQNDGYLVTHSFDDGTARGGKPKAMRTNFFATPESVFGSFLPMRSPDESQARLAERLAKSFPRVSGSALESVIGLRK